jgi:hypothetical protein
MVLPALELIRHGTDDWAMKELTGHYVNYRKQVSPSRQQLLPEHHFRLYAVCARPPHNLAQEVPWEELRPGVYQCRRGTDRIRVLVAGQLPRQEQNALLHLFSAERARVDYGASRYTLRSDDSSSLLQQLFVGYRKEGIPMPYTMQDFRRDFLKERFQEASPQERKELLRCLTAAERQELLHGLTAAERQELLHSLTVEERLEGLPLKQIERYLKRRKKDSSAES